MKRLFSTLICAGIFAAAETHAAPSSDLIARIYFAGARQISADADSRAFTNEFCSAAARALESQTLDKLSKFPYELLKGKMAAGSGDGAARLRPLTDDFLKSEWIFEMRDAKNGSPEYALAIRLNPDRAQLWQNNLRTLLESWTKIPTQKIPDGWQLKKHLPPNLFRSTYSGGWLLMDCGENELTFGHEIFNSFAKTKIAETNWLTADVNWPRLAQLFPALAKLNLPKTEMRVVGRDGNLRLNGKFTLAQPLPASLEKWQIPTNTIHEPFVSFTAARGFLDRLKEQNWARPFEIQPGFDQIFIWAMAQIPFQTFFATPVSNATNVLAQFAQKLSSDKRWENNFFMPLTLERTPGKISWKGMPFIAPEVSAVREKSGDFLVAGFFPNTPKPTPLPPELFARLNRNNLVYYHWEITAERLKELPQLTQLALMLTNHRQLDANSAAGKWLAHIGPTLGNNVTEITKTGPNELTFTRKAPGGLTAIELIALANWLEAPNFPGCDLRMPAHPKTLARPHMKIPSAPPVKKPASAQPFLRQ